MYNQNVLTVLFLLPHNLRDLYKMQTERNRAFYFHLHNCVCVCAGCKGGGSTSCCYQQRKAAMTGAPAFVKMVLLFQGEKATDPTIIVSNFKNMPSFRRMNCQQKTVNLSLHKIICLPSYGVPGRMCAALAHIKVNYGERNIEANLLSINNEHLF